MSFLGVLRGMYWGGVENVGVWASACSGFAGIGATLGLASSVTGPGRPPLWEQAGADRLPHPVGASSRGERSASAEPPGWRREKKPSPILLVQR